MATVETDLKGSNNHATVTTAQDGAILRGDFTDFKVQGDAGVDKRLMAKDRFIVGGMTSCVFTVVDFDAVTPPTKINVKSLDCGALNSGNTVTPLGLSILIPWNGDDSLVKRVLEAASTTTGRKVSVEKTAHGKYGEMSWFVQFILIRRIRHWGCGSFFMDFHSSFGPREMAFNEDAVRLERKLNEMDTIGRVSVERFEYPSTATGCTDSLCSGGWEDQPVLNPGTRGGYRWRIRFLCVTGEYEGVTFPPGSGNLGEFTVDYSTSLNGNDRSVVGYPDTAGSDPILGNFMLSTPSAQTPSLLYSSSAEAVKQGIEAMDLFGEVDVTQGFLITQKIPGVTAKISRDSLTATVTGVEDIRQFISPTDIIRFGSTSADNLVGSNGDTPFTASKQTSLVTVGALSPIVVASDPSATMLLYPGMQLRIDGLPYDVQRSGHEIQTITVSIPKTASQSVDYYALTLARAGNNNGLRWSLYGITGATVTVSVVTQGGNLPHQRLSLATDSGQVIDTSGYYKLSLNGKDTDCISQTEIQRLRMTADAEVTSDSTGLFQLQFSYAGETAATNCISYGVSAVSLQKELNGFSNLDLIVDHINVTREGDGSSLGGLATRQNLCSSTAVGGHPALIIETVREGSPGYIYDIFFLDYTNTATIPTIWLQHEAQGSAWSSEIQELKILNKNAGGKFVLTFAGQTTSCLAFSASASAVEDALNLLSTIGGGVLVSRDTDVEVVPNGFIHKITFVGDLVTGNVPLLSVQEATTACLSPQPTTKAVITLDKEGGQNSGEFSLTSYYNGEAPASGNFESYQNIGLGATYKLTLKSQTTAAIPWDASERALEAALTVMGVSAGDITVTRRSDSSNGFVYTIYFSGLSVTGDLDPLVPGSLASFGSGKVVVSTIRDGTNGVSAFTPDTIPLAKADNPDVASPYLASASTLDVFKVNGLLWTIKFKSSLGNIPKLGKQTKALTAGSLTIFDDFIPGSASNSYVIPNLLAGINYYVHVAAMTDIGTGLFSATGSIMPSGTASAVQNIHAGYAVYEREVQEIRLAASHVSEVQEITTEAASIAEVQTLRTYASSSSCPAGSCIKGLFAFRVPTVQTVIISAQAPILSGTFTLLFTREVKDPTNLGSFKTIGAKTGAISWNADASTVKNELVLVVNGALTTNDIVVTRDGDASEEFGYGYVFQITFIGNNVAGETKKIDCADKTFVTTGNVPSSCGVTMDTDIAMGTDTAVQQVIVTAKKPLVAGSYSLRFTYLGARKDSSCIPFDASASIMDITLEAMDNIDKVYVTRQRDSIIAPNGFIYRIFFHGNGVNGDVNKLDFVMCTDFQTQEKNALTTVGVDGQVLISMVDYGGFNPLNTFVSAASATAAQLTTDLAQLPVFGDVLVSQSLVDEQGGYIWTVAFKDSEGNLPQFICAVDSIFESAAGAGCETDTLTDGNVLSAALEAMAWVGTVQVKQSAASSQRGYTWTITFLDYRGDVPTLLVTSSLVGTGSQISVREVRKGNALGGTFSVSYQNSETAAIDWDELAMAAAKPDGSSMQEKIQALDVVGQVNVERSGPDSEGGYSWLVTFLDNILNSGDLPLLLGNSSALTGEGAVVFTKEITKGSNAVGDLLWLSFDPPATDNGSPITKYQVRWDTSDKFTANPADVFISDADKLYRTQRITTSASSLAWSNNMIRSTALEALTSVGSVDVSSVKTVLEVGAEVLITFTAQPGDLPPLKPSNNVASVEETQAGRTNFRKEVVVFSCTATQDTVRFTYNGEHADVDFNAALDTVETSLLTLFGVEAESISVTSATQLGVDAGADAVIVFNTDASIDGVYNNDPALTMSGTFQVGYQGLYTRPLNAESSADQLRYALEDLDSIQTVSVTRELSYQPLLGKIDVTEGEIFVTCSTGETCNFYSAAYGLPGYKIRIGKTGTLFLRKLQHPLVLANDFIFPPATVSGALIQGSPPFRYLIANLIIGTKYFVRVAAVNSVPVQQIALNGVPPDNRQWSSALSVLTKDRAPDAPLSVALYPYSGTILQLQIQPSTRDGKGTGGLAITAFWIDIDTVSTFDSVTKSNPIEVLNTTFSIPELRATLAPAPVAPTRHSDGPINAKVTTLTVSSTPIDSATVTWQKPVFNGGVGLTSYKIEWWRALSRPEVQVVELKWVTSPTSAPFALSFRGGKSEYMDRDVSAENLRSALMNMRPSVPNYGACGGLSLNDKQQSRYGRQGGVFELTSGIAVPVLTTFPGKPEVQVLVTYHATTTVGGYFRLGYKGSAWTNYLPASVSANNLKLALENLPTIGVVNVNLESMAAAGHAFTFGQVWTITFISNVGNLPPLTVEPSKLTPFDAFLGVKDGDNTVDGSGVLCLPGSDISCPDRGLSPWSLRQQAGPKKLSLNSLHRAKQQWITGSTKR
ncbi:Immunoglobulin-like fold [Phytophthora cactorum]|nr:Immunoglobulin-like fold [Phytophthora cactorum]